MSPEFALATQLLGQLAHDAIMGLYNSKLQKQAKKLAELEKKLEKEREERKQEHDKREKECQRKVEDAQEQTKKIQVNFVHALLIHNTICAFRCI